MSGDAGWPPPRPPSSAPCLFELSTQLSSENLCQSLELKFFWGNFWTACSAELAHFDEVTFLNFFYIWRPSFKSNVFKDDLQVFNESSFMMMMKTSWTIHKKLQISSSKHISWKGCCWLQTLNVPDSDANAIYATFLHKTHAKQDRTVNFVKKGPDVYGIWMSKNKHTQNSKVWPSLP